MNKFIICLLSLLIISNLYGDSLTIELPINTIITLTSRCSISGNQVTVMPNGCLIVEIPSNTVITFPNEAREPIQLGVKDNLVIEIPVKAVIYLPYLAKSKTGRIMLNRVTQIEIPKESNITVKRCQK